MQRAIVLVIALLAAGPLAAQGQQPVLAAPQAAEAPDTAAAIQWLFATKRRRQHYATGATAVAAVATLLTLNNNQPTKRGVGSD